MKDKLTKLSYCPRCGCEMIVGLVMGEASDRMCGKCLGEKLLVLTKQVECEKENVSYEIVT